MKKVLYKPVGLIAGAGAGLIAGYVFKKVWQLASGDDDAPDALQGAIFAIVKAAVDRGSAEGVKKLTGSWPG